MDMPNRDRFNSEKEYREWYKKYREKNGEKIREYEREYRRTHRGLINDVTRKYRNKLRDNLITIMGGTCVRCGFADRRCLQIDHKNGGGRRESKTLYKTGNYGNYYKNVLASIAKKEGKYQLLCANCNWIKRVERDETGRILKPIPASPSKKLRRRAVF